MNNKTRQDPLHGITLKTLLTQLVEKHGWEELGQQINIKCFTFRKFVYSFNACFSCAITCAFCAAQDGKVWEASEVNEHDAPPYRDCEGEDRCRCVWIYTFKTEAKPR